MRRRARDAQSPVEPSEVSEEAPELSEEASEQSKAVFASSFAIFGPFVDLGFGFAVEGHRVLFTQFVFFLSGGSPFIFPFAVGVQWSYEGLQVWPRYVHWFPVGGEFVQGSFGQGGDLQLSWGLQDADIPIFVFNYSFLGNVRFNNISKTREHLTIYDQLTLAAGLYSSSPFFAEHLITAVLSGGVLSLVNGDGVAYNIGASLPMNFWSNKLLITPRVSYSNNGPGSIVNTDNSIGYNFTSVSSFDIGAIFNIPSRAADGFFEVQGNTQFSLNVEGRWYFLEQRYESFVSGFFLTAFTDVAYTLNSQGPFSDGTPGFATGGGLGFTWFGLDAKALVGYEYDVGFRLNIGLVGGF